MLALFCSVAFCVSLSAISHDSCLFSHTETITVDLSRPENNGPAMIVEFTNYKLDGIWYNGFKFEVQDVDLRFMFGEEEHLVAYHLGGGKVFMKLPSTSYSWLYDKVAEDNGKVLSGDVNESIDDAEKHARQQIAHRQEAPVHLLPV